VALIITNIKELIMFTRFKHIFLTVLALMTPSAAALAGNGAESTQMLLLTPIAIGAVMSAQTLIGLQKSFRALFLQAYEAYTPDWPRYAMEIPSEAAEENYQWLGTVPAVKEWVDVKTLDQLLGFNYSIRNKDWEATLEVDRNDIEDDRLGMYRPRILEMAQEAKRHPEELISQLRRNGASSKCYDGKNFYATDHVIGKSGTMSNKLTGTGVTVDKITADFRAARAALRKFKDDRGRPFVRRTGKLDLLVTVPPDLEGVFEELANATLINNTTNVLKGAFEYRVDPFLTDTNDWYVDYVGGVVKPFIFQNRKNPDFVAQDQPDAESVFMRRKVRYGTEARYNAGYALWQYSILVTNT